MNQILSLREKRAKAWDAAKAFLDSKRGPDQLHHPLSGRYQARHVGTLSGGKVGHFHAG